MNMEIKNIVGFIAIILIFIGYAPYIRDVIGGKTRPHIYGWFLWGVVTCITFALQVSAGGGVGAYVTLASGIMCLIVFFLGLTQKGKKDITKMDTIFLIVAFIALGFWLVLKQPAISAVLITAVELLGFVPTIRKSWNNPKSETLSFYLLNILRFVLAIFALQKYTIVTTINPIGWIFGNGVLAVLLLIRRKQLKSKQLQIH